MKHRACISTRCEVAGLGEAQVSVQATNANLGHQRLDS
jgi:hypothetical protein